MESRTLESHTLAVPTPLQIALALAVIRTKPDSVSVRDYILNLRSHLKRGIDPLQEPESDQYLDHAAYWQERCRQLQAERDQLRSANIRLEQSHQLLEKQLTQVSDSENVSRIPKRRRATAPATRSKCAKTTQQKTTKKLNTESDDKLDSDLTFLNGLGDNGAQLSEAMFTTHRLCQAASINTEQVCQSLTWTSTALSNVICMIARKHTQHQTQLGTGTTNKSNGDESTAFDTALGICARAFVLILAGIGQLVEADAGHTTLSPVLCQLSEMFKSALSSIEVSTQLVAQQMSFEDSRHDKEYTIMINTATRKALPARAIAHLLITFLGLLDRSDIMSQQIFEALVFVLFERAGRRLYYCTFKRQRSNCMGNTIAQTTQPQNEADAAKHRIDSCAIRLEILVLVPILEKAVGLAARHLNSTADRILNGSKTTGSIASSRSSPATSGTTLSPMIRDRLQRTLISCMYGEKPNDKFLDTLRRPMASTYTKVSQKVDEVESEDIEEWYKQEMWRLIGWDIIAREDGW